MDTYSLMQILKEHSFYKNNGDAVRGWILAATVDGHLNFAEFMRYLEEQAPALALHLRENRTRYRNIFNRTFQLRGAGYGFACFGEELYPADFYLMEDPPLAVSFLGSPAWLLGRSLSVVGSRDPRDESVSWMEMEFGEFLNQERVHVVSGGARGIDQKAHSLALRRDLPTTVILPSGLGSIYPSALESWKKSVLASGGCFLSEYAFEQPMRKHFFLHRNRLIAALGQMILLVEARRRSGSLISADQAIKVGRPVMVVPGHPQDKNFSGNLDLLADGALLVRDAQDLGFFYRSELWSHFSFRTPIEALSGKAH